MKPRRWIIILGLLVLLIFVFIHWFGVPTPKDSNPVVKEEPAPRTSPQVEPRSLAAPKLKRKHQVFRFQSSNGEGSSRLLHQFFSLFISEARAETEGAPRLEWESLAGADSYEIEVALDQGFTKILKSWNTKDNFSEWNIRKAGTFFWHVRGIDSTGKAGSFSEIGSFEVVLAPRVKRIKSPVAEASPEAPQEQPQDQAPGPAPIPTPVPEVAQEQLPAPISQATINTSQSSEFPRGFAFDVRELETWGTLVDSGGVIPSRTMLTSSLGVAAGIHWRSFVPSITGEYLFSNQITSPTSVQNQNTSGQGYLLGAELKWLYKKFTFAGSYLFLGQYSLSQQTTLSQPMGLGLSVGYDLYRNFFLSVILRNVNLNNWNLGSDTITQFSYGVGLSYKFR